MDDVFAIVEMNTQEIADGLRACWEDAFQRTISDSLFDWIFGPRSGNRVFAALHEKTGEVAAGYCMLQQRAVYQGEVIPSYMCNNVFTGSRYRQHNLFVKMGRHVTGLLAGSCAVALGFPNQMAVPGHKRVGWKTHDPLPFWGHSLIARPSSPLPFVTPLEPADLDQIEDLWLHSFGGEVFRIIKDKRYFTWRYHERPVTDRQYFAFGIKDGMALRGYALLSHYAPLNKIHVVDICARDRIRCVDLLRHAVHFAATRGATSLNTWASPFLRPMLADAGFSPEESQNTFISNALQSIPEGELAASLSQHHLVLGDNDVF